MSEPRYKCWTKGIAGESGELRRGAAWVGARRAWFRVFDDRIECGDWTIASSSIKEAVLFEARQWLIPVFVLRLTTMDTTYQFGFNPWCRVAQHLHFVVERRRVRLGYSAFSIVLRIAITVFVTYWLWRQFG